MLHRYFEAIAPFFYEESEVVAYNKIVDDIMPIVIDFGLLVMN